MTRDERIALYRREMEALIKEQDATVIFHLATDENKFAQFTGKQPGAPLLAQVANCAEGWDQNDIAPEQVSALRALGFDIPGAGNGIPHKQYPPEAAIIANQVEQVFRSVFNAPEDYTVDSSGVMW